MAQKKNTPPKNAPPAKSVKSQPSKAQPSRSQPSKTLTLKAPISKSTMKPAAAKPSPKIAPTVVKASAQVKSSVNKNKAQNVSAALKKKPVAAPASKAKAVKPEATKRAVPEVQLAKKPAPAAVAQPKAAATLKPAAPKIIAPAPVAMPKAAAPKIAAPTPVVAARPAPQPVRAMPATATKPAAPKLTSPPTPVKAAPAAPAPAAQDPKKPVLSRHGFKTNESIVYPAHGVGKIIGIEEQEIAGITLELFVIQFEKDKMTLRVPTSKLQSVGMRKLAEDGIVRKAMETLKGKARIKRTMWSRRAQEYEQKINSGDLVSIAEVVRDLYRSEAQPEQSYSERQLYEAALDRMAREIAAVDKCDERTAMQRITEVLSKSAKGRRQAEEDAAQAGAEAEDAKAA
jgi:CarD family transcriptional regulator